MALVACWAAGAFATSYLGSVVSSWYAVYNYPGGGKMPLGLCYDAGYMYVSYDGVLNKREAIHGSIVDVVGLPQPQPYEIAFAPASGRIWCGCYEAGVYLLDPETGSYVASFPLPGEIPNASAICYDRTLPSRPLWVTDPITWRIWNLTTAGSLVRSIQVPANSVSGLAYDNDAAGGPYLFVGAWSDKARIHAANPANGSIYYTFTAPVTGSRLQGLTWDGEYLWTIDSHNYYVVQFIAHEPNLSLTPASLGKVRALFR